MNLQDVLALNMLLWLETVATLSQSAHDAFPDPKEAVDFAEKINKVMAIGGTTGENKRTL